MLAFFANASDFTRRLTSVTANGKFASPDAGPDSDWEAQHSGFRTVIAHLKRK
jgi:raffinose synthase